MAKDNLFLGMARGSVGSVTFARVDGQQVSRARNRSPRNPQSPAQMVQRIIMSSVGKAYSFMQPICNHSFEGFEMGQQSQRKFMEVNVGILRDKVADVLAYPVESAIKSSDVYNFSFKNDYAPVLNAYQISAGSLPSIPLASITENEESGTLPLLPINGLPDTPASVTYQQFIDLLGLQRGDQLTFIQATHDNRVTGHDADILTGFRYCRVILDPASGDMSVPLIDNRAINDPNPRNEGSFSSLGMQAATETRPAGLRFIISNVEISGNNDKWLAASAVILSRQVGNRWLRSTQFLLPRTTVGALALKSSTLGLAYETYRIGASSDLYLNQAE